MTLDQWIEHHNVKFRRENIRPWGTYDLLVSTDGGSSWAMMPRPFGYGFREIRAFELVIKEYKSNEQFKRDLESWMGVDRTTELLTLFDEPTSETVAIVPATLLPETT